MVNAQEWLDQNYPRKNEKQYNWIYVNEQLEGELDLVGYSILWGVLISYKVDKNKFKTKNGKENVKTVQLKNAREWLNSQIEYNTEEKKNKITSLTINQDDLEGNLDLTDFINLQMINIGRNNYLSIINISSERLVVKGLGPTGEYSFTLVNTQKWLDKNYPRYGLDEKGQKRSEVKELNPYDYDSCSSRAYFSGSLILLDFTNLESLYWNYENRLTSLDLSNCPNLQSLDCGMATLNDLILPNSVKLKELRLLNCSSLKKDLMFFSRLINLESLSIWYSGINGSLKALKNLTKLKSLDISGTNIDSGLEYLPESLEKIRINHHDEKNWGAKKIQEQLREYVDLRSGDYLLNPWRENNAQLVNKVRAENRNYQREMFEQEREEKLTYEEKELSRKEKSVSNVATQTDLTTQQIAELEELKAQIQALVNK
ncbi:MAG: hypothetical protein I3273_01200 [Candidatus Moeniiplasma glomeromycotorum]|nr:hypothetical protein [Candidatus Moeniiplasma glomeromycotorum]MCE8167261.1 hypothetical protein [Candidatus Moeniiplasma glomeromycotorum]MCE8168726.1 hypothetical protein [Candidatus Moeniiplasma glomeromycotorum]